MKLINFYSQQTKTIYIILIFFVITCFSCDIKTSNTDKKYEITDEQYKEMRYECSKLTGKSKRIFLDFELGCSINEFENHLDLLIKSGKIKIKPKISVDQKWFEFVFCGPWYIYDFVVDGITKEARIYFEFDLSKKNLKCVSLDILYKKEEISLDRDLAKLFESKYGEPVRVKNNDRDYDSYYWLKNGYEIEIYANRQELATDLSSLGVENSGFMFNYIVFNVNFTELSIDYSDSDVKFEKEMEKIKEGEKKMINDL